MIDRRVFLATSGCAIVFAASREAHSQARITPPSPDEVFRDPDIPVLENVNGDVTVVSFFDYNCPFCKADYPVLTDVVRRDGNVRLVMKDRPILAESSRYASGLVLGSARTPDYTTGMDALMDTQGWLTIDEVEHALRSADLDVELMHRRYEEKRDRVEAIFDRHNDQALGLRIRGTPGYVIGRRVVAGSYGAADFEEAIAEAREAGGSK